MKLFASEIENSTSSYQRQRFESIIKLLKHNPIKEFSELELEYSEEWKSYDLNTALNWIAVNNPSTISFRSESSHLLDGFVLRNEKACSIGLYFSDEFLIDQKIENEILKYLQDWRTVLPNFGDAMITADDRDNEMWDNIVELDALPDCFGSHLGWYHVISRRGYEPFFKREDLLNTPALNVEELDDGTICILSYAHPLDYTKPDVTQKIIEITNYLTEKWYEHDASPDFDLIGASR